MAAAHLPLLVISGPVGVGKTTVGNEVSTSLERRGVAHTFIDLDALAATYPRPPDDRFGNRLALLNLRHVWINCAAAGSRNLIVDRVVETQRDLAAIERAVPNSKAVVCQLRADDEKLLRRVRMREVGSRRDWHEARALELARSLEGAAPADIIVDTSGRSVPDIAAEITGRAMRAADFVGAVERSVTRRKRAGFHSLKADESKSVFRISRPSSRCFFLVRPRDTM